ncbi:hypothetical protein T265_06517 [Opisthorchis viverrini]|uniref:Uncharacterized protein n=1 Tax=Opisthorchis viverrini TaxID=6198 RepID=A0A074ZG56_OPIVI|nr:hypothetical protein T265_06517 [Opisthorchis viverrini]KER26158.1 hypothetical protein T265_06517 [Opisthorchis viverrini]
MPYYQARITHPDHGSPGVRTFADAKSKEGKSIHPFDGELCAVLHELSAQGTNLIFKSTKELRGFPLATNRAIFMEATMLIFTKMIALATKGPKMSTPLARRLTVTAAPWGLRSKSLRFLQCQFILDLSNVKFMLGPGNEKKHELLLSAPICRIVPASNRNEKEVTKYLLGTRN